VGLARNYAESIIIGMAEEAVVFDGGQEELTACILNEIYSTGIPARA
jgi:ABC-type phosphate/phosphonate transport system ATPase subunit